MVMSTACPSQTDLKSYAIGEMGDENSDLLLDHVRDCDSCQSDLLTLEDSEDTLIRQLRSGSSSDPFASEPGCREAVARAMLAPLDHSQTADFTDELPADRRLGEYELRKLLGRGGMGSVYRARHTKLDRAVAMKILPKHRLEDDRALKRFEQEMRAIGRLDHPDIVTAFDAREIDDVPVIVMEFVDGLDAGEIVRRMGPLSTADACEIVRRVALALEYVREHGLVHRDIKPSNVMVSRRGEVKLLDLGLARLAMSPGESDVTGTGQTMGTADYVAPEQITDSHDVDIRADIYSLGCTLFKLLAGEAPFPDETHSGTFRKMTAHVSQQAPQIRDRAPAVPARLADLVTQMLAKSPSDRPATPADVAAVLQSFCKGANLEILVRQAETIALDPDDPGTRNSSTGRSSSPTPRGWRFRRYSLLTVALLMLLSGASGFAMGIIVKIRHADGSESEVEAPNGSKVAVDNDGNVSIDLPGANSTARDEPAAAVSTDPIQGTWNLIEDTNLGPNIRPAELRLIFADGKFRVFKRGQLEDQGTYKINPGANPPTIDLNTSFDRKARRSLGIYRIVGDRLYLCISGGENAQRPQRFEISGPPNHSIVMELRRGSTTATDMQIQVPAGTAAVNRSQPGVAPEIYVPESSSAPADPPPSGRPEFYAQIKAARARAESKNNLKQIGLALHNYHDVYRKLPAATIRDKSGKALYSWRVAILPFVGEAAMYEQLHRDEPWDSEHNSKVLAKMPNIFRAPGAPADSTSSSYYAVVGPMTAWPETGAVSFRDVLDGNSNTIAVVEAKRDGHWAKPDDLQYQATGPGNPNRNEVNGEAAAAATDQAVSGTAPADSEPQLARPTSKSPVPKLGGLFPDGYHVVMMDGAVKFIPQQALTDDQLRALLTRNGNEAIRLQDVLK